jgi:hypothetical protein
MLGPIQRNQKRSRRGEFVTAARIYKKMEGISDEDALEGLPLLLTGEANL